MTPAPRFRPDFMFIPRVTKDQTFIGNSLFGADPKRMLNMMASLGVEEEEGEEEKKVQEEEEEEELEDESPPKDQSILTQTRPKLNRVTAVTR